MFRTEPMSKRESRWRLVVTMVTVLAMTGCVIVSVVCAIHTPILSIAAGYVSILAIYIVTYKLPFSFFVSVMCFDIFAPGLGTIVNLYRTVEPYDLVIHYLSGILLCEAGRMVIEHLLRADRVRFYKWVVVTYFVLFSCMGAGLWEIYEFTGDQLLATHMQGNNLNTMGDMVSGFLGAVTYAVVFLVVQRKMKSDGRKMDDSNDLID